MWHRLFYEHLQQWWLHHHPVQPVPMPHQKWVKTYQLLGQLLSQKWMFFKLLLSAIFHKREIWSCKALGALGAVENLLHHTLPPLSERWICAVSCVQDGHGSTGKLCAASQLSRLDCSSVMPSYCPQHAINRTKRTPSYVWNAQCHSKTLLTREGLKVWFGLYLAAIPTSGRTNSAHLLIPGRQHKTSKVKASILHVVGKQA